jgi:hypothetical protein
MNLIKSLFQKRDNPLAFTSPRTLVTHFRESTFTSPQRSTKKVIFSSSFLGIKEKKEAFIEREKP